MNLHILRGSFRCVANASPRGGTGVSLRTSGGDAIGRLVLLVLALVVTFGCADDSNDKSDGTSRRTVPQVASQEDRFAAFSDAVDESGLTARLDDPEADFTVFAPNNEAFAEFEDQLTEMTSQDIVTLLAYHVVPGVVTFDELSTMTEVTTLDGEILPVVVGDDGSITVGPEDWQGTIVDADIPASNGILHEIDGVLFSPEVQGE